MDLELHGKRAFVTGSSSGIGAATAKILAAEGAKVVVHGRSHDKTRKVVHAILAAGGEAGYVIGELDREDVCADVVEQALAVFGGIDILVNNAGGFAATGRLDSNAENFNRPWLETPWDDWMWTYEQNVGSSVRLIQALAPAMIERGWGRIINLESATLPRQKPVWPITSRPRPRSAT